MKEMLVGIIKILIIQVICYIIPVIFLNDFFQGFGFGLNIVFTWKFIKKIEMGYYNKYNRFNSMLYMICPVIGISLTMYVIYLLTHELFLCKYYITLIVGVYILNTLYIIGCYVLKNK